MKTLNNLLGALCLLLPVLATAQAPKVIRTTPENGARDVDPDLTEIIVVFDQPMRDKTWSWCGGGEQFPEIDGSPSFRNPTTAVLPVKLRTQHSYSLGINCPAATNFIGQNGMPAKPFPLQFTTGSGEKPALAVSNPNNAVAYRAVRDLILNKYSHYERTGTDWEKAFSDSEKWVLESPTPSEWGRRVAEVLGAAEDVHLYLLESETGKVYPTHRRNAVVNGDQGAVKLRLDGLYQPVDGLVAGNIEGIGYIGINTWGNSPERAVALDQLMQFAKQLPALIIDVRLNGGGSETGAREFAKWFITEPSVYSKNRYRDSSAEDGWTGTIERIIEPNPEEKRFDGKVILLQGPVCLSSNESFILMMKQSPNVTTMGAATGGSSANPKEHELPNGFTVVVPSWQDFLPDGTPLEGNGIVPDIEYEFSRGMKDNLFERALEMAHKP